MNEQNQQVIEAGKTQQLPNPNKGLSKKERRRIEILKQKLEPRVEKLEAQITEQIERISAGCE